MKLNKTVLRCINCDPSYEIGELNKPWGHTGKKAEYYKGFIGIQIYSDAPDNYDYNIQHLICPFCNNALIDTGFPREDLHLIGEVSSWNRKVLDAMMQLRSTDPIEYQLKLNQFKLQKEQHDSIVQQQCDENIPKCPHCKSTKIKKISGLNRGASIMTFGIFSKKINKSFECKNCGYTW